MKDADAFTAALNAKLYGAPPSKEVSASEAWDYCYTNNPKWPGHYYRHGDGVRVLKGGVKFTRAEYDWVQNEEAERQLRELMAAWRARGWGDLAEAVEEREEGQDDDFRTFKVYEQLGKSVPRRVSETLPLSDVRFFKEMPYASAEGLRKAIDEPRSFGRITGLSTSGLEE